jgi:hypothetical protein
MKTGDNHHKFWIILLCCVFWGCSDPLEGTWPSVPSVLYKGFTTSVRGASFDYIDITEMNNIDKLLTDEINKYPEDYFKKINLYIVAIVKNLKVGQHYKAAMPDHKHKILFISVSYNGNNYTNDYLMECYHHDQHHYAEYALWGDYYYRWDKWEELYTGGYEGGETAYGRAVGFLNDYQQLGPEEDRAEIIAYYMTPQGGYKNILITQAKNDTILDQKVTLLFSLFRDRLSFPKLLVDYNMEMGR